MIVIITEKRAVDWVAYLKDKETTWEAGRTEAEAVGKLVITISAGSTTSPIQIRYQERTSNHEDAWFGKLLDHS